MMFFDKYSNIKKKRANCESGKILHSLIKEYLFECGKCGTSLILDQELESEHPIIKMVCTNCKKEFLIKREEIIKGKP